MRIVPLVALTLGCLVESDPAEMSTPTTNDPPAVSCLAASPVLELGMGESSHAAVTEFDSVFLVHGPQGGWHLATSGAVSSMGQEVAVNLRLSVLESGDLLSEPSPTFIALADYDDATCSGLFWGVRAVLTDIDGPFQESVCDLAGEELLLEITVEDFLTGRQVTESVVIVVQPDPIDPC